MSRDYQEMPLDDDSSDFACAFEASVCESDFGDCFTETACHLEPNEIACD